MLRSYSVLFYRNDVTGRGLLSAAGKSMGALDLFPRPTPDLFIIPHGEALMKAPRPKLEPTQVSVPTLWY